MSTESTGVLCEIVNVNASHRLVSVNLKSMSQNTQVWQMNATWKDLKSLEPMGSKRGPSGNVFSNGPAISFQWLMLQYQGFVNSQRREIS